MPYPCIPHREISLFMPCTCIPHREISLFIKPCFETQSKLTAQNKLVYPERPRHSVKLQNNRKSQLEILGIFRPQSTELESPVPQPKAGFLEPKNSGPEFGKGPACLHVSDAPSGVWRNGAKRDPELPNLSLAAPPLPFESSRSLLKTHLHHRGKHGCALRALSWLRPHLAARTRDEAAGPGPPWSWCCSPRSGTSPTSSAWRGRCTRASPTSWEGGERFSGDRTGGGDSSTEIKPPGGFALITLSHLPPRKLQALRFWLTAAISRAGERSPWVTHPTGKLSVEQTGVTSSPSDMSPNRVHSPGTRADTAKQAPNLRIPSRPRESL